MTTESNHLEFIKECTLSLRERDRKFYKTVKANKYKSPWDIDWMRLKLRDNKDGMPFTVNGVDILLLPNSKVEVPKGQVGIDIADFLVFQFLSPADLGKIMQAYKVFGVCTLTKFPDKSLDSLIDYCSKMDAAIVDAANKCKEKKIVNIFEKIWKEMGGEMIRPDDLLGKRIEYYKDIVARYKKTPTEYEKEIKELKLLG